MTPRKAHDALRAQVEFYEDLVASYEGAIDMLRANLKVSEDTRTRFEAECARLQREVNLLRSQLPIVPEPGTR